MREEREFAREAFAHSLGHHVRVPCVACDMLRVRVSCCVCVACVCVCEGSSYTLVTGLHCSR
jgi:hypothetical protein